MRGVGTVGQGDGEGQPSLLVERTRKELAQRRDRRSRSLQNGRRGVMEWKGVRALKG